jgi:hypothetical protein
LVVKGELATGCCANNSISMKLRISARLLGTQLQPGQLVEVGLATNDVSTFSGMQDLFTNTEIIIFMKNTPKGLQPVSDAMIRSSNLPTIKKLIAGRSRRSLGNRPVAAI